MQSTRTLRKTTVSKGNNKEKPKDDGPSSSKNQDENVKKSIPTPRSYVQKSTTSDIYMKKNTTLNVQAPKKSGITNTSNTTPMKEYLRSSPSSISQISNKSSKLNVKNSSSSIKSNRNTLLKDHTNLNTPRNETTKIARKLPFSNVTVNSPVARRKNEISHKQSQSSKEEPLSSKESDVSNSRQRTKTRTLDEKEIKILTPDIVDNNSEMLNLKSKLNAKSKAFYVGLNEKSEANKPEISKPSEEEDDSYEDDFESYESDFDSYHSDPHTDETNNDSTSEKSLYDQGDRLAGGDSQKENRDEEKMLDSGNFDLHEAQRSAQKHLPSMGFILEGSEDVEKRSLIDEGFQELSSSSAVSSMKTLHVELFERPLFIDFTKSKEKRRKQKEAERLKQRAKEILSMVTLHEMSYTMFEMKPIPYDLYMATFGRFNYIQATTQTFDDGITEEVQTEEVSVDNKWTQHPVEFSKHDVYLKSDNINNKFPMANEDYLTKFTFLINKQDDNYLSDKTVVDKDYKANPLRIYLEQRNGVGADKMLSCEDYKNKLLNKDFNTIRLKKFLKRVESSISNILSLNTGNITTFDINKSRLPFSKGYHSVSHKNITNEKFSFLNLSKIMKVIYSDTKSNCILTISQKSSKDLIAEKAIICLWDVSVALREPIKILVAIENVSIGRFWGNTDGIFIAGLEDGSIHLWDLSEEPIWHNYVGDQQKTTELVKINNETLTETERDREWNLKNSQIGYKLGLVSQDSQFLLQSSAYTSSAMNMNNNETTDSIVGLEFMSALKFVHKYNNGKILGQICSLQQSGRLIIWNIIQDKCNTDKDIGKAYWSKMKLDKSQTITLAQYLDIPVVENVDFNLNAAKRRNLQRRRDKMSFKQYSRQNSAASAKESDRPSSSKKMELPVVKTIPDNWGRGIVCKDLKILSVNDVDNFIIAKNCGEVLICVRRIGEIKVNIFCIANDTSTITSLAVSPHGLPYFLAATDTGTVNLCSVLETRVLLTLDCRNGPAESELRERCQSDHKGRFTGTIEMRSPSTSCDIDAVDRGKWCVTSLCWCKYAPCRLVCVSGRECRAWLLPRSDIRAQHATPAVHCVASKLGDSMALLTPEGEVQIHRITNDQDNMDSLELFKKYVALL